MSREETTRQSDGPRHHSEAHELVVKRRREWTLIRLEKDVDLIICPNNWLDSVQSAIL